MVRAAALTTQREVCQSLPIQVALAARHICAREVCFVNCRIDRRKRDSCSALDERTHPLIETFYRRRQKTRQAPLGHISAVVDDARSCDQGAITPPHACRPCEAQRNLKRCLSAKVSPESDSQPALSLGGDFLATPESNLLGAFDRVRPLLHHAQKGPNCPASAAFSGKVQVVCRM